MWAYFACACCEPQKGWPQVKFKLAREPQNILKPLWLQRISTSQGIVSTLHAVIAKSTGSLYCMGAEALAHLFAAMAQS